MDKNKITVTMPLDEFEKITGKDNAPTTVERALAELMVLSLKINSSKKATVFIEYSGHVDLLRVNAYRGEWTNGKEKFFDEQTYLNREEKYDLVFIETCKSQILKAASDDGDTSPAPQADDDILF